MSRVDRYWWAAQIAVIMVWLTVVAGVAAGLVSAHDGASMMAGLVVAWLCVNLFFAFAERMH